MENRSALHPTEPTEKYENKKNKIEKLVEDWLTPRLERPEREEVGSGRPMSDRAVTEPLISQWTYST